MFETAPQVNHPQVDAFLNRTFYWPHWLSPSPRVTADQVLGAVRKHLERLRDVTSILNIQMHRWQPVIVQMTPEELSRKINLDSQWHHVLIRTADLPASLAYNSSGKGELDKGALANRTWETVTDLVREQVWQSAAERLVGCWHRSSLKAGLPWQLTVNESGEVNHALANTAMSAAQQVALHHAMNAVWLVMEPTLLARQLKNPYADLIRVERWGYVVLGPDGQKMPVTIRGKEKEVPRFVIAQLVLPNAGKKYKKR